MGVKRLIPFIQRFAPKSITVKPLDVFRSQSLAVDANIFLNRFLRTPLIRNSPGSDTGSPPLSTDVIRHRHIYGFFRLTRLLQSHGITPVFVFDGPIRPEAKKLEIQRRQESQALLRTKVETEQRRQVRIQILQSLTDYFRSLAPAKQWELLALYKKLQKTLDPKALVSPNKHFQAPPQSNLRRIAKTLLRLRWEMDQASHELARQEKRANSLRRLWSKSERDILEALVSGDLLTELEPPIPDVTAVEIPPTVPEVKSPTPEAAAETPPPKIKPSAKAKPPKKKFQEQQAQLQQLTKVHSAHVTNVTIQSTQVNHAIIRQTMVLLREMGFRCYMTNGEESEALCAALYHDGLTQGTLSDDTDLLLLGNGPLLRSVSLDSRTVTCVDPVSVKLELELTTEEFVDFCILCGTDFCSTLKQVGPIKAIELIRQHHSIEEILKVEQVNPRDNFNFEEARRLLTQLPTVPHKLRKPFRSKKNPTEQEEALRKLLTKYDVAYEPVMALKEMNDETPFVFANEASLVESAKALPTI
ncbi:hypothetical protein IWQ61_005505, partial [Dispira simplex]